MISWHPGYVVASNLEEGESLALTYTVKVNWTDANGARSVKTFQDVVPADGRWPSGWTVLAVVPGTAILCVDIDNKPEFWFFGAEKPKPETCP